MRLLKWHPWVKAGCRRPAHSETINLAAAAAATPPCAAGAPPYAADLVFKGCTQICLCPGGCQFGGIRSGHFGAARARHLHQLRQKHKLSAGLAWKTSYPSVNVTFPRSALDSRVKESIIMPLTQLRVGACLFIMLLWTALTHVLHEISVISASEATPPHCYSPCGGATAKSPQ